jgi:ATP-dependent DNA helicase DinG
MFFRRPDAPVRSRHPIPPAVIEELENLKGMLGLEKVSLRLQSYGESGVDDETEDRIKTTIACAEALDSAMNDFIRQEDNDRIYYLAGNKGFIELKSSMVESRAPFADLAGGYKSLVMTSATMTSGGDFAFIRRRLGIAGSPLESGPRFKEMIAGSPFDYKKQCMLYVERDLPRPDKEGNEDSWREGLKVIEGLIDASKGRALVLFTSYKHLDFVSKNVTIDYPFKSQGDKPPGKLIEWFKKTSGAVLLATATFWQGIDIKGEKLGLVIIVKMPFGSPGEPVYDERCRRLGGRWFTDLALPSAILTLRQGFGRLIRSAGDYGIVAILDPRLLKSSYGGTIIASLPEMRTVHDIAHVKEFFEAVPLSPDEKND